MCMEAFEVLVDKIWFEEQIMPSIKETITLRGDVIKYEPQLVIRYTLHGVASSDWTCKGFDQSRQTITPRLILKW